MLLTSFKILADLRSTNLAVILYSGEIQVGLQASVMPALLHVVRLHRAIMCHIFRCNSPRYAFILLDTKSQLRPSRCHTDVHLDRRTHFTTNKIPPPISLESLGLFWLLNCHHSKNLPARCNSSQSPSGNHAPAGSRENRGRNYLPPRMIGRIRRHLHKLPSSCPKSSSLGLNFDFTRPLSCLCWKISAR